MGVRDLGDREAAPLSPTAVAADLATVAGQLIGTVADLGGGSVDDALANVIANWSE